MGYLRQELIKDIFSECNQVLILRRHIVVLPYLGQAVITECGNDFPDTLVRIRW